MRLARYKQLHEEKIFSNRMDAARKIAAGFPAPLELGPNTLAWDYDEILDWLASRPRRHPKCDSKAKQPAPAAPIPEVAGG